MKTVFFIVRDGYDADYIISQIAEVMKRNYHIVYVIEKGNIARKKKFFRMIHKEGLSAIINMAYLVKYDRLMMRGIVKNLGNAQKPKDEEYIYVNDVNDLLGDASIPQMQPDLFLVYGSGIIKQETINYFKTDIFNIHSSVLPYYRNVHSDFWAYKNKDYEKIGVTIFKLDSGIDSGAIAMQKVAKKQDKLYLYKVENLRGIVEMIPIFLEKYFGDELICFKQDVNKATIAYTPSTRDIINFLSNESEMSIM